MAMYMMSNRIPSSDPVIEAFVDTTYAWLEELEDDYERCMGHPFEGGGGILFASDVLVLLHGREADWARWDVHAFERVVREQMPDFTEFLPMMLAEILAFVNLHTRRGRIPRQACLETQARTLDVCGIEVASAPTASRRRGGHARRRRIRRR